MTRLIMARSRGRLGSPHEVERNAGRPRRLALPLPDYAGAPSGLRALLVGAGEIGEQAVAALDRGVERLLRGLLPGPHRLELLVHDVADLHEVADAQALRVVGRRLEVELLDRHVAPGELIVEALRARERVGRLGDGHVAGLHVP